MPAPRLAVTGYASIDEIHLPGEASALTIGGGAIYAALAAVRAGVAVSLHVAIGEDFPRAWIDRLSAYGIDVSAVDRRSGPTRRSRLHYDTDEQRRASSRRDPQWWERTRALRPPIPAGGFDGYLVCPAPLEVVRRVSKAACGAPVVADTSEAFALDGPAALATFAMVSVFAPSLDEVHLLSREPDEERAIARLAAVAPVLIVKKGRRGLSRHAGGEVLRHVPPAVRAVDPTGAGDSAVGALAGAILLGMEPARQLAVAAEAGGVAIGAIGPAAFGW
jgi:sugar/nucleoside kinase (ribokinase family)